MFIDLGKGHKLSPYFPSLFFESPLSKTVTMSLHLSTAYCTYKLKVLFSGEAQGNFNIWVGTVYCCVQHFLIWSEALPVDGIDSLLSLGFFHVKQLRTIVLKLISKCNLERLLSSAFRKKYNIAIYLLLCTFFACLEAIFVVSEDGILMAQVIILLNKILLHTVIAGGIRDVPIIIVSSFALGLK